MVDFCTGDRAHVRTLYLEPLFEKCLEELQKKGGEALVAAEKAEEFIRILLHSEQQGDRGKFRFTRNGEARIRNCKKVDLGCGYRLVCIKRDGHLALLYIGTHDDCFRWIERNTGMEYTFDASNTAILTGPKTVGVDDNKKQVLEEDRFLEQYESSLMSRIDDDVLRKVFHGLCKRATDGGRSG